MAVRAASICEGEAPAEPENGSTATLSASAGKANAVAAANVAASVAWRIVGGFYDLERLATSGRVKIGADRSARPVIPAR